MTAVVKYVKGMLKWADQYQSNITLNYKNSPDYTTIYGGVVSIVVRILIFVALITSILDVINYSGTVSATK